LLRFQFKIFICRSKFFSTFQDFWLRIRRIQLSHSQSGWTINRREYY